LYDATPDVVYVGYTPGYYGTVMDPTGVVVYGTGYSTRPGSEPTGMDSP